MPGLVPGIRVLLEIQNQQGMDGRDKCGHDGVVCGDMAHKKIGPAEPARRHWGLNRTRNSTGPAGRAPGGWGAEESGVRTGPGHEATLHLSRPSVTGDCSKLGLFMCGLNDFVNVRRAV